MKKVVDFDRIKEVSKLIKNKCDNLDIELDKIVSNLIEIGDVDKTDNMNILLGKYNNEVNELKKFINVIDYYTNYMDKVCDYYSDVYNDYNRKLVNNLREIGGNHGKN